EGRLRGTHIALGVLHVCLGLLPVLEGAGFLKVQLVLPLFGAARQTQGGPGFGQRRCGIAHQIALGLHQVRSIQLQEWRALLHAITRFGNDARHTPSIGGKDRRHKLLVEGDFPSGHLLFLESLQADGSKGNMLHLWPIDTHGMRRSIADCWCRRLDFQPTACRALAGNIAGLTFGEDDHGPDSEERPKYDKPQRADEVRSTCRWRGQGRRYGFGMRRLLSGHDLVLLFCHNFHCLSSRYDCQRGSCPRSSMKQSLAACLHTLLSLPAPSSSGTGFAKPTM